MLRNAVFALMLVTVTSISSSSAHADYIFQTAADIDPSQSAASINDTNFVFHRFEIVATTTLGRVGGYFSSITGTPPTIFAAVVQLSGDSDNPDSLDLSTPDVLGTTLINVGAASGNYSGDLLLTLTPGWYALEFGTGLFGAGHTSNPVDVGLQHFFTAIDPSQMTVGAVQVGHPTLAPGYYAQSAAYQFFATPVPEPSTMTLVGIAMLGVAGGFRKKKAK